jgi:hypothetical protein
MVRVPTHALLDFPRRAVHRLAWGSYDNNLIDNDSCVIVGVQATAARMSQETAAAQDMITRFGHFRGPYVVAWSRQTKSGYPIPWHADQLEQHLLR